MPFWSLGCGRTFEMFVSEPYRVGEPARGTTTLQRWLSSSALLFWLSCVAPWFGHSGLYAASKARAGDISVGLYSC
jgi:hypothetical protein